MVQCVGLRGRKLQLRQCQCSQSPPAELQTNLMTSGITYGEIDFLLFPALEESTCNLHTPKKVIANSTFSLLFRKRISKAQFVQSNLVNLRWRQRTMTKKKKTIYCFDDEVSCYIVCGNLKYHIQGVMNQSIFISVNKKASYLQ